MDREQRLFNSREAVDEYLLCGEYSEAFYELQEAADPEGMFVLARAMLGREILFESSHRRWQRVCIRVARDLERYGEKELALKLYSACHIHPARERRARILEARKSWTQAIALCGEIEREPWCEAELEAAHRIARRALRNTGGQAVRVPRDRFEEIQLVIAPRSGSVEEDAARCLSADWTSVHYVENQLMNTLFGLAFWEQIFSPVPGAFHNPYQGVPADMYDGTFRLRRAGQPKERLEALRDMDLRTELAEARRRFGGYQCHWVDWVGVSDEIQDSALRIIPSEHLFAIWERQLFDPGENRSGFPDLIAFGERPGDYCMIEVKGPGDRLQDNQKRWLRYFADHEIPAKVAWVEWDNA